MESAGRRPQNRLNHPDTWSKAGAGGGGVDQQVQPLTAPIVMPLRKEAGDPKAGTVELPLVLSADEAVRLLCGEGNAGLEAAMATAYGVSRTEGPRSADQRVGTLAWFANDLEKAGLGDTASSIHRTLESWQGMEARLIARLDSIAPKAPKTRGGEDRRLDLERGAGRGADR